MKNERWKVHICLIGIVVAAVTIGICYYYTSSEKQMENAGDILVEAEQGGRHGC